VSRALKTLQSVDWRGRLEQVPRAIRAFDWRRLPNLETLDLRRAAGAVAVALVLVLSVASTIRARPWARDGQPAAGALAATPAPVIKGLVPNQTFRVGSDVQPIAIAGARFVENMSVTISTPHALVTTYGSDSLSDVTPTRVTIRALVDVPGAYDLVVRTPSGARSNAVTFVVGR
jgi:hypothetical protein